MNFIYVDTGALYRTLGLAGRLGRVDIHNPQALETLLKNSTVELKFINGEQRVFLNGEDVSEKFVPPR